METESVEKSSLQPWQWQRTIHRRASPPTQPNSRDPRCCKHRSSKHLGATVDPSTSDWIWLSPRMGEGPDFTCFYIFLSYFGSPQVLHRVRALRIKNSFKNQHVKITRHPNETRNDRRSKTLQHHWALRNDRTDELLFQHKSGSQRSVDRFASKEFFLHAWRWDGCGGSKPPGGENVVPPTLPWNEKVE